MFDFTEKQFLFKLCSWSTSEIFKVKRFQTGRRLHSGAFTKSPHPKYHKLQRHHHPLACPGMSPLHLLFRPLLHHMFFPLLYLWVFYSVQLNGLLRRDVFFLLFLFPAILHSRYIPVPKKRWMNSIFKESEFTLEFPVWIKLFSLLVHHLQKPVFGLLRNVYHTIDRSSAWSLVVDRGKTRKAKFPVFQARLSTYPYSLLLR